MYPTEGEDYIPLYENVVLYAASNETCVRVYTIEDYLLEGSESFTIYFRIDYSYSYPSNIYIDDETAYIVIMDDESEFIIKILYYIATDKVDLYE